MSVILAAIDNSGAALPVLRAAAAMARMREAEARAVHVREGKDNATAAIGLHVGLSVEVLDGDPVERIVEASANAEVDLVVIGARRHVAGLRTFGHVARAIMTRVRKPVLVVPPDSQPPGAERFQRILIPLEGTVDSADAVAEQLRVLTRAGAVITVVHVFHPGTVPRFWDQAGHAHQSWASEFLAHWCAQPAAELFLRSGDVADAILEVATEEAIDLIVLGWSQNMTGDRARVVRDLVSRSKVPVLLAPVTR